MCNIQAGYFVVNGITPSENTYHAFPRDQVYLECWVIFDKDEIGKEYKAELKVQLPNGKEYSYYSPLTIVNESQLFDSPNFEMPIPVGRYSTAWFVIYDNKGNTKCSGHARGLNCENLVITET